VKGYQRYSIVGVAVALLHVTYGLYLGYVTLEMALLLAVSYAAFIAEGVLSPPPDKSEELKAKVTDLESRLGRLEFKAGMPR
jgi:hypothetical protein